VEMKGRFEAIVIGGNLSTGGKESLPGAEQNASGQKEANRLPSSGNKVGVSSV